MIRINSTRTSTSLGVQVTDLGSMFTYRGYNFLCKYRSQAEGIYQGVLACGSTNTELRDALLTKCVSRTYGIAFLCVYLAIADLAYIYDVEAALLITSTIWSEETFSAHIWDIHPYSVAIRLASEGYLTIWSVMLQWHRDHVVRKYLSTADLIKVHKMLEANDYNNGQYEEGAKRWINIEIDGRGYDYDKYW